MRQSGPTFAVALLVALLTFLPPYALSTGPAWKMVQEGALDRGIFDLIYAPLFAIPVVDERLARYSFWWEFRNRLPSNT